MIRASITFSFMLAFFLAGTVVGSIMAVDETRSVIGPDMYTFGEPQYIKDHSYIKIVTYDTFASLALSARIHGFDQWQAIRAFAIQDPSLLGPCTVHMVDPRMSYDPDYVGHEMLHCFFGNWHRNAGEKNQTINVPQ